MLVIGDPRGGWLLGIFLCFLLALWLRRRTRVVRLTTFFLVRRAAQGLARISPRLRLLRRLRVLLFLAAVLAVAVAGLHPRYQSRRKPLRELAVIDLSASLGIIEAGRPRRALLQDLVRRYAAMLQAEDSLAVVWAGGEAAATPLLAGAAALQTPAGGPDHQDAPADIPGAMRLVRAHLAQGPFDHVLVFTDAPSRWSAALAAAGVLPHFVTFGAPVSNAGIVGFDLRPRPFQPGRYDGYLRLLALAAPEGIAPRDGLISITNNGKPLRSLPIPLAPGEAGELVLRDLALEPGRIEAHLEPEDAYPADNHVVAGIAAAGQVPVRLVSVANRFLREALAANPEVRLTVAEPGAALPRDPQAVHVFDGVAPEDPLPQRALFIQPGRELEGLVFRAYRSSPERLDWDGADPVLQGVDVEGVSIKGFMSLEQRAGYREVVAADGHPLLLLSEGGDKRWAVLAFDPSQTNLVYQASYPILVANLVRWLSLFAPGKRPFFTVNDPVLLPEAARGGTVVAPDGKAYLRPPEAAGDLFLETRHPGRYQVFASAGRKLGEFSVNVLDEETTKLIARPPYGGGPPVLPDGLKRGPLRVELFAALVLLALGLLAAERIAQPPPRSERE